MATTITRIPASFRLQSSLIEELKSRAKASNRSLNNYVESLLINVLHPTNDIVEAVTTDMQSKIDKVVEEHSRGEFFRCNNKQELQTFLDSI